jgi:acyl-CoA synthetase (NDP forming)
MLSELFNPRSIAVIGASPDENKMGNVILKNLISEKYEGEIYPINPKISEILGLKCYKNLGEINKKVDLAVIALRAEAVPESIKECVDFGVKFIIPIAGGFSETGKEGELREKKIKEYLKKGSSRVIGPNTVGIYIPGSKVNTALTTPDKITYPKDGSLAFITQSGALGLLTMDSFADFNVGFSAFVNLGNRIDIDENELLTYFSTDQKTKAILFYIETFKNGRAFTELARDVITKKPVVVLKAGRTNQGAKAASLHTGALGGDDRIIDGIFKQSGIIRAYSETELIDYGRALAYQTPLLGDRLAILTTAGGAGVVSTDYVTATVNGIGLKMAELKQETKQQIKSIIAPFASAENPIDLTASGGDQQYNGILKLLNKDDTVDGIIVYALFQTKYITENIIEIIRENIEFKPIIVGVIGGEYSRAMLRKFEDCNIPTYPNIERTVKAMKVLYIRGNYLTRRTD